MDQMIGTPLNSTTSPWLERLHEELSRGDWQALHQTSSEWLLTESPQPVAMFVQNMACLFINPPAIIQNKSYLETVSNKDWKAVNTWFKEFQTEADQHNPYFQALAFILHPQQKKAENIEAALGENPHNAELLFLQAISLSDKQVSIERLKSALEDKPEFPACLYLLGIFSLQLNQISEAENYLKQAVELAPDFLEAHYQLGSLYTLYIPDSTEQARLHFERVIELDPEGGAGKDAKKVLESKSKPQYGQRVGTIGGRRGGMSIFTILGISLLTALLFSGPIATLFKIQNQTIGIIAGLFVFIGLYSAFGKRK